MWAVVTISGKQYKVQKGDRLVVDKVDGNVGDPLSIDAVHLVSDENDTKIGTPHVKGAKVISKIVVQGKGEKIEVRRFKSKVRERRHIGFRPFITTLEITDISA